ncbi:UvrD-helicase domain-containing protein, partial [Deinococcus ruber]|uniref:UvrD-helicase domain-containing protein n=1 Tax=Deinococcus ruber TaxID=1848197 RepID=UPI00166F613F
MTTARHATSSQTPARQAPLLSRPIPSHFTDQQIAFLEAVRDTTGHLMLRATAGSGKTTTLTEAAWHLNPRQTAWYFAYNKHSVDGISPRLPRHVKAATPHAYGRRILCRTRQDWQLAVDEHKTERLARTLYAELGERADYRRLRAVARLWDSAREYGLDHTSHEDDLIGLASVVEWPDEPRAHVLSSLLSTMQRLSLQDWASGGLPDFTDFLWLPLILNLEPGSIDTALIDECQDLTPLRQTFLTHLLGLNEGQGDKQGRLIAVGDPAQAIYSYAGADPRGMWRLTERIGATELPLSVSWRCPALHIELARTVNTFIESAPGAPSGTLEHHAADELDYQAGDVILSRLNSPLIRAALHLMTSGTSVNIRGRDLATRLEAAATEAFPKPFVLDSVKELVNVFYEKRAKPFIEKAKTGDPEAKKFLTDFKDICSCLRLLGQQAAEHGLGTAQQIATLLRSLYREDADVLLSTIHRAKGLEWDRVTLLYPELMPLPSGNYEEEQCVLFVALTRSKDTLRLAYGKEAWANGERLTADKKTRTPPSAEPLDELLEEPLEAPPVLPVAAAPLEALADVDWEAITPHPAATTPTPTIRTAVPPAQSPQTPPVPTPQRSDLTPTTPTPVVPAARRPVTSTPIQTRIFQPRAPQDEEEELGHQMLQALSSLTLSTPVPVPTPPPERGLADHARKLRQLGQSSRLDDPRPTPLFHGQDSGSVSELRLRLDA